MENITFMSRNGLAVRNIARDLLDYEVGSRIPRINDFSSKYGVGRGTVQSAFQLLTESKAVKLDSRGHLGTFLAEADFVKLWTFAGRSNLMGAMPLPYSRRYEGLATGLYEAFAEQEIPFHLSYMRGGVNRVQALCEGRYDFAVLSNRAAEKMAAENRGVAVLHSFEAGTYVGAHGLLVRDQACHSIKSGMRIGIDSSSIDQYTLTKELCKNIDVEFIELPYMQIMEQLFLGNIDAAVWNIDEVEQRFGERGSLHISPLEFNEDDATSASLVVRQEDLRIFNNLLKRVNMETVLKTQRDVLEGRLVPRY